LNATQFFPPGWRPEKPGETLEGTIVARRARVDPKGDFDAYQVFEVETPSGDVFALHAYPAALRRAMSSCTAGDQVSVTYKGRRRSKNGRTYKQFVVKKAA
jgi:hypothetical protein